MVIVVKIRTSSGISDSQVDSSTLGLKKLLSLSDDREMYYVPVRVGGGEISCN